MNKTAILIAVVLGMAVTGTLAQQPERPPGGQPAGPGGDRGGAGRGGGGAVLMNALDLNKDGTLDAREIQSAPMSLRTLDKNKDFRLTPEELGTSGRPNLTDRLMQLDANKDGKISSNEVPERMKRFVERADTNGDGVVDKAEIEAMQQRIQDGGPGRRGAGPNGGPRGQQNQGNQPDN